MIARAVLRKVVGAIFSPPPAGADLATTLRTVFLSFLALLSLEQARPQNAQRPLLVFDLASPVLTTHDRSRGNMQNLHRGVGRIHALPAWSPSARNFDAQIVRLQFKIYIRCFGQH